MFRILRALSLDVVLGGLAVGSLACRHFEVTLPLAWWLVLALSIWIVYSLDRLLDAARLHGRASTFRHRFHYRHFYKISLAVAIATGIAFYLSLLYLNRHIWLGGIGLVIFCAFYLALAQWRLAGIPREPLVAIGYTGGILLGPVLSTTRSLAWHDSTFIILIFLAALLNLLVFAHFEKGIDQRDSQTSLALMLSGKTFHYLILLVLLLEALCLLVFIYLQVDLDWAVIVILGIVAPFPILVLKLKNIFALRERYRIYCDSIFSLCFLPALISLVSGNLF